MTKEEKNTKCLHCGMWRKGSLDFDIDARYKSINKQPKKAEKTMKIYVVSYPFVSAYEIYKTEKYAKALCTRLNKKGFEATIEVWEIK